MLCSMCTGSEPHSCTLCSMLSDTKHSYVTSGVAPAGNCPHPSINFSLLGNFLVQNTKSGAANPIWETFRAKFKLWALTSPVSRQFAAVPEFLSQTVLTHDVAGGCLTAYHLSHLAAWFLHDYCNDLPAVASPRRLNKFVYHWFYSSTILWR